MRVYPRTSIVPFEPHHLDGVVDLSLKAWSPVFVGIESALTPALYRQMHPDWRADQRAAVTAACDELSVWVAIEGDRPAGFVAVKLHEAAKMGEIYMIAVDPDHQRKGIARALADIAVEHMRQAGMTLVMIETGGDPGHAPARAAYEALGYHPFPSVRYFKSVA
ncbi:MAG: GNAT family N-acetyltransferase [Deltaproteobacteria bacterium]|nr:GNAT family N-acetyltransferase [Deltaproteobacteria bacterium]